MSLQVCHCGWSKVTSYQGLRTHQGKMGCTPKGMSIPKSQQYQLLPTLSYRPAAITVQDPFIDIFKSSMKSNSASEGDLQVCHCGWSKVTTYQGLRTHQGKMGCTPQGMRIPENKQYTWEYQWEESQSNNRPAICAPIKEEKTFSSLSFLTQMNPTSTSAAKDEQLFLHTDPSLDKNHQAPELLFGAKGSLMPTSQIYATLMNPPATQTPLKDTHQSFFQTPTLSPQTTFMSSDQARRALDFSTGDKVDSLWEPPATKAQEPQISLKEKEKEEQKEAEKLLQVNKERMRAKLQQRIHIREVKVVEIKSSAKTCKASLDAEWLEINDVFSEVMGIVEDARQKALKPLEKRRQKMKKEAQDLVQKLQNEIDKLKMDISELDKTTDLQVSPLPGLHEATSWENQSVDTSVSFGSLRATTATMVKDIQQKLENLSSLALLKR